MKIKFEKLWSSYSKLIVIIPTIDVVIQRNIEIEIVWLCFSIVIECKR